jgi:hypothetical protein
MSGSQYERYCLTDPHFYDAPDPAADSGVDFPIGHRPVPEGWNHAPDDTWMYFTPRDARVPAQGWKIHVSARLADAERTLDAVWDYCVPRGIAFKFLRGPSVLVMLNSKAAPRGSSGKLVTIYPTGPDQLELVLKELDLLLAGVTGPYILSDLRYADGPLFVRYGGFVERYCLDASGARVLALENADGELVPDVRGPVFSLPPWVNLPGFLDSHLAARNAVTTEGLPYEIESVLQFSNGGGVYLARDLRTGNRVVLKEGRPHAGLDSLGRDAVSRIDHERRILERLAGLDVVPAVVDSFTLGEHRFLVTEFVDANPLQRMLVQRYPLTHPDCTDRERFEYATWALETMARVERAVTTLHAHGVVYGDLHPMNILVRDDRLVLIDFEVATLTEEHAWPALGHPAYQPPPDRRGVEADRYSLACLWLGMFAPQTTTLLPLHRAKATQLGEEIARNFPVPRAELDRAVNELLARDTDPAAAPTGAAHVLDGLTATTRRRPTGELTELPRPGRDGWETVRAALAGAILASATPERDDRLFPGDIAQFVPGGGLNLAHGAAGVLHALAVTGAGRVEEHERWLLTRMRQGVPGMAPGLWDGLHGVAHVLDALGYRQDALDLVDRGLHTPWDAPEPGLYSGLAGVGLNLLHLAGSTGETELGRHGLRVVDILAEQLGGPADVSEISGGDHPRAGLMFGSSGSALLFLHAHELTGDAGLLDLAGVALRQDLRRCIRAEDGTYQVNQGWRTLPYLDEGSIGIALVLARYLDHRADQELEAYLPGLEAVAASGYFVQSGLLTGRAGILAAAGMRGSPRAAELAEGLAWHALPYADGLAFPGDQLLRLSMDLATGTAGVLLALGTAAPGQPAALPFLRPAAPSRAHGAPHDLPGIRAEIQEEG